MTLLFGNASDFFSADQRRIRSSEVDFGFDWKKVESGQPRHRVSWIRPTGELYAIEQAPRGPCPVELLGVIEDLDELERLLAGWEDEMWKPGSLAWVRGRMRQARDEAAA